MATDLVTIATTAVLTQFLTPTAKNLGEVALERAKQIGSKAVGYLAAVGREAQPVEEKILYPLLQAASLESNPSLTEKWVALLANAADPAQRVAVHPGYADILRQLTPEEAKLLDELFAYVYNETLPLVADFPSPKREYLQQHYALKHLVPLNGFYYKFIEGQYEGVPEPEIAYPFDAMIDSFLRQRILALANGEPRKSLSGHFNYMPDRSNAFFTSLGYEFMLAVTPPAA